MSARISIAVLWLIWARLKTDASAASSGERVHIRLHMPDVVRQHTHFHKVYKHLPHPLPPPQQLGPVSAPMGKPHVSLLGYTTTASGSGSMAPSLRQLMATPMAMPMPMPMPMPTLTPNYGPALFDSYNQQQAEAVAAAATPAPTMATPEPEPELENNELLNENFMAALQREYLSKFGGSQRKRKKVNFVRKLRGKPQPQLSSEEQFNEYQEPYLEAAKAWTELGDNQDENEDDSAAAFSGQNNALSSVYSLDEFLNDVGGNAFAPHYGSIYNEYGNNGYAGSTGHTGYAGHAGWQSTPTAFSSYARRTKATPTLSRARRQRLPNETGSGMGSTEGSAGKVRYIKLTTRKKRKNRIKAKRYRI
ncbi:uncharacterized protein LOC115763884 [Drosophila novamexicana]|uniref:uncharacterized protein LOC115763884 n=1 Tax=Drosophila novamexicana TaxID=47314 RepID=UPI0011E5D44F|nr:uncharacterized protein LOC115763884 [Drosophila novamexicana]